MALRKLTLEEVKPFAERKGAKSVAVYNFLTTVHANPDTECAYGNLELDARLYKWNAPTKNAIRAGIALAAGLTRTR